jgi:hypothetical protein
MPGGKKGRRSKGPSFGNHLSPTVGIPPSLSSGTLSVYPGHRFVDHSWNDFSLYHACNPRRCSVNVSAIDVLVCAIYS